jgi:UDP-2,4-diacetamido-2,4,6-trideoxy-beta-L-altropyranose hydrolase
MDKKKIFFRADGDQTIGMGHFTRTLALTEMLNNYFYCVFATQKPSEYQINEIAKVCHQRIDLPNDETHFSFFLNLLQGTEIVVLDNYYFTTEYQQQIKNKGCKLVCIDDLHDKYFLADLIINHTPGIIPGDYKAQPYTQYAFGLDYALLRPPFLEQAKTNRIIERIDTLLICFGGADPNNFTLKALHVAIHFEQLIKIIVAIGSCYSITPSFETLVESDTRIKVMKKLSAEQMLNSMLDAQLAIVPSSGILLEAISAGCIIITGIASDNQKFVYLNYTRNTNAFDAADFSSKNMKSAMAAALTENHQTPSLIDGKSGLRILKLFNQLITETLVNIRNAEARDLKITFNWATNPIVRLFSFQKHAITLSEHSNWFNNKLRDRTCYYFIAEYNKISIGSIRFDIDKGEALISYLLDPKYHGKDLGSIILKKGIESLSNLKINDHSITSIVGYVMPENIPSIRSFEKLGFLECKVEDKIKFTKWL